MQQHVPSETASSAALPHADEATDAAATTETGAASPRAEHAGNTYAVDLMTTYNRQLIAYATTRQYESSVLPGRQFGIELPRSPFSALQQRQSKCDELLEVNKTMERDIVEIVEQEPAAHIAREQRQAAAEHRRPLNAYSQLTLTGHSLTMQPAYLQQSCIDCFVVVSLTLVSHDAWGD